MFVALHSAALVACSAAPPGEPTPLTEDDCWANHAALHLRTQARIREEPEAHRRYVELTLVLRWTEVDFGHELLTLAREFPCDGIHEDAVHLAHTVLGLAALKRDAVAAAERHLLWSAGVSGSPVLSSFGPSMRLARALLERGRTGAVLNYLERCKGFWESRQETLSTWQREIREGIGPDFGPNVNY